MKILYKSLADTFSLSFIVCSLGQLSVENFLKFRFDILSIVFGLLKRKQKKSIYVTRQFIRDLGFDVDIQMTLQ